VGSSGPIATDANFIYFGQPDGVYRVSNTGGSATTVAASRGKPAQIVPAGGFVYWIDSGTTNETGAIMKVAVFPD
jgi:hypothetical protein